MGNAGFAQQTYNTPCEAEAMPIDGWAPMDQSQNVRGDLTGASPFITDIAGGTQDFGCTGSENAIFYKVEFDPAATRFSITYNGGTATNISVGVISLGSTECGGGTAFGESVYLDAAGNEMVNCDLIGNNPVQFDLCEFTSTDFNNLYLWLSTAPSDEGGFNIDINQFIPPVNDDCTNATDVSQMTSRGEECHEVNNFGACSDLINLSMRPDPADEGCFLTDPSNPTTAGVWAEFTTDGNAGLVDLSFLHANGQQITVGLYAADPDCSALLPVECWSDDNSDGIIDNIENINVEPNSTYYLYIYTDKALGGSISFCIDIKEPLPCGAYYSFYNFTVPVCNMSVLNNYCLNMSSNPDYVTHDWPGGCPNRTTVENPNWFSFVAGSDRTILEFEVSNCQNRAGVEIGVFELPCEDMIGIQFPGIAPIYPNRLRLLSDCSHITCYNDDTVQVEIETYSGGLYGVMIDGCSGDECDIEINVIEGNDAPDISGPADTEIVLDDPSNGFDSDTICIGAEDIDLYLNKQIEGACAYIWYQIGGGTEWTKEISKTYDFPDPGSYYFQVYGTNYCSTTDMITKEIVAVDLPPFESRDTICEGDGYTWIGPYGNEIVPNPPINSDFHGDYVYRGNTVNSLGCMQSGTLRLYVRDENDEFPTIIDSIVCAEDLPVTIKGASFTGGVNDVIISQPIANHGCDTFFSVNLTVLGGPFFIRPECDELGNVIFRFEEVGGPQTSWYDQFALYNDPNNLYSIETEFIAVEKDSIISTSLPMTLSQKEIEQLAENGALNVQLRIVIKYDGQVICNSISPPVEFNLDDNFPRIDKILGDTAYCPGQKELKIFADVHHPLEPAPFGEFPDSIGVYNWYPPMGFTLDTAAQYAVDTLIIDAPDNPTDNTICLTVITERCLFTDSVCRELVIEEPFQPILEANNETCDTLWSFSPDTAVEGAWTVLNFPASGNTAVFADSTDPGTTVSVTNSGLYTFLWREGAKSCAKYDSVSIDFLESTVRGIVQDSCIDLDFFARVTLIDGRGGYTIHPSSTIDGTITDSTFISDTIAIDQGPGGNFGEVRYLVVEDSLGCISDPIPIRLVCNCETEVGNMSGAKLELCEGDAAISQYLGGHVNDGTDTLMFVLHSGPLSELQGIIDTSMNGMFAFDPDIVFGQSYYISAVIGNAMGAYVDLNDPCLAVSRGQEVVWYENPMSNAGPNDTICGLSYTLRGIPSTGNFSWRLISGPGNVNFQSANNVVSMVTVTEAGTYTFLAIEQNFNCRDSAEVSITFGGEILHQIAYDCDAAATSYIATITLSGGGNSYELLEGQGTLNNNIFTSLSIPKGEPRQIIVQSDLGCGPDTILFNTDCECLTETGTFFTDTLLIACEENCINASSLYDPAGEFLDGNDIGMFILHGSSDTIIQAPVFLDPNGDFCYSDISGQVNIGDTIYVAYVIGSNDGNGQVDLSDPCLQVTNGAAVVFEPAPIANAGSDSESCGLTADLTAMLNSGTGNWSYLDGPSSNVNISSVSFPSTSVTVDQSGLYRFIWEVSLNECTDTDTVQHTFLSVPDVTGIAINCDSTGTTYIVEFTIVGGDSATYSVSGLPGTLNGRSFMSDPIEADSTYRFLISDGNNCDTIVLEDDHDCNCITSIGSLIGEGQILCEDETLTGISYDDSGEVRDANDQLIFILTDSDGNIVARGNDPGFSFDPDSMNLGETYYLSALLGSVINGLFQFDESCTQQSILIPVEWHAYPEAEIQADFDTITCSNPRIIISGTNSSGQNLTFRWTTSNGAIVPGTENSVEAEVTGSGLYILTVTDSLTACSDSAEIQIYQSDDVPEAIIVEPDTLDCQNTVIRLDGSLSSTGPDIVYEWTTTNGNILSPSDSILIRIDQAGQYTLTVLNTSNDCEAMATVTVAESQSLPVAQIAPPDILGCDQSTVILNGEGSSQGPQFDYLWKTNDGNILSDPNNINAEVSEAGTYVLIVENLTNGCYDSASVTVLRDTAGLSEISVDVNNPICFNENNGMIRAEALDGNEPITYRLIGIGQNDIGVFTDLPAGDYRLEVEDASGCLIVRNISLTNPPEVSVTLEGVIEVQKGDSAIIEAMIPSTVVYDSIIWDTDTVPFNCLNADCSRIEIVPPADMMISVRVVNGISCFDTDSSLIIVEIREDPESIYIPNVFTPNDDGINDVFIPEAGLDVRRIDRMQIFDRWGNLIFESREFLPTAYEYGWDGTYRGSDLQPAVFTYQIEVVFNSGKKEIFSGTVSLVK